MDYEEVKSYKEITCVKDKKPLNSGKLEVLSLKAIDKQEFEMPMVCH